ncbi:glycosyltransferase family 4 protein [Pirellulaceae bacterium SH467]
MRVLLVAEQCNPSQTSVPLQIANYCRAIAAEVDEPVVVTAVRNKQAIDQIGLGRAQVVYIDNETLSALTWKVSSLTRAGHDLSAALSVPLHRNFEKRVLNEVLCKTATPFDIVHRISPASSAVPSWLASRCPVPFVIGPINGGLPYPPRFKGMQFREGEILRFARGLVKMIPGYAASFRSASAVIASFPHTACRIPLRDTKKIIEMPDVGADASLFYPSTRNSTSEKCRFIFVGRLVPFKCPLVLVEAFAKSKLLRRHELVIIGDGPEGPKIDATIRENALQPCVKRLGKLPQPEVAKRLRDADVFAFPSVRDSGGAVTPEAMMSGLPCIAIDYGPPKSLLCKDSGILVPLGSWDDHVQGFQEAMERMVKDTGLRHKMGEAAYRRASALFSWGFKAKRIREVYEWVLGNRVEKPDFYSSESPQ